MITPLALANTGLEEISLKISELVVSLVVYSASGHSAMHRLTQM